MHRYTRDSVTCRGARFRPRLHWMVLATMVSCGGPGADGDDAFGHGENYVGNILKYCVTLTLMLEARDFRDARDS